MNYQIGLKLFSRNTGAIGIAQELFANGYFDYIELLALPGSFRGTVSNWLKLNVPYVIHAPHELYGLNLADKDLRRSNQKIFAEAAAFADKLKAREIIIHPGLKGDHRETAKQLSALNDDRLLVENMPFISLLETKCVGCTPAEIGELKRVAGVGFCFDVAHAVKAAFAFGQDYLGNAERYLALRPAIIHICDTSIGGCFDEHLALGKGKIDFRRLSGLVRRRLKTVKITLEIPERSYKTLEVFKENSIMIKKLLAGAQNQ
ncbi:MAG: TIM barrel protein [Candidatus Peribacteraceae bacterium]